MPPKRAAEREGTTPSPHAKRARQTPPKVPAMTLLSCATKEELVAFVKQLCVAHPEVRDDVRAFKPTLPIEHMLVEIEKAAGQITKKLPWDRYGRGNGDTYAYNRVKTFISTFAKLVTSHLKTVEKSGQHDKIAEFLDACQDHVLEMHTFSDPAHNAARTRLMSALAKAAEKIGHAFEASDAEADGSEHEMELGGA
mmetsp:Transcript_37219/g.79080  ORF Transcript_37219/g.79080 Transcript_37219/m.79080 type:complete len:196 (+) Transcript_37219:84-671(+)